MNATRKVLNGLTKVLATFMIICMVIMVVFMFLQVVLRYVFGMGISWAEELSRFTMIFMTFIGAAVLCADDSHISVTIVEDLTKGVARKAFKLVKYIIMIAYSGIMAKIGFDSLSIVARQTSPNLNVTMDLVYGFIPVGMCLMILYNIVNIVKLFTTQEDGSDIPLEAKEALEAYEATKMDEGASLLDYSGAAESAEKGENANE